MSFEVIRAIETEAENDLTPGVAEEIIIPVGTICKERGENRSSYMVYCTIGSNNYSEIIFPKTLLKDIDGQGAYIKEIPSGGRRSKRRASKKKRTIKRRATKRRSTKRRATKRRATKKHF